MMLINALEVPADVQLASFSRVLSQRGVEHRVTEEGLNQVIWVATEIEASLVRVAWSQLQSGQLAPGEQPDPAPRPVAARLLAALKRFPVTLGLIAISLALFPVGMGLDADAVSPLLRKLMFLATRETLGNLYPESLAVTLQAGEYWRLITPMFIHFSVLHILFNLLWIWEIGRRIESENGSMPLLALTLLSSVSANLTQYWLSGPGLFGGMSGVVFGVLGYAFVWSRLVPGRSMNVPVGLYVFMLAYLAVGFTGLIDLLGFGSLANGAHLGGLIGGLVTGGLAGLVARGSRRR